MRSNILFGCFLLLVQTAHSQLYISSGAQLYNLDNVQLTLHNINLVTHGDFFPGTGNVSFTGNSTSVISGTQTTVFNKLEIGKTGGAELLLMQHINIKDTVRFTAGNMNLNGRIADLGISGTLHGENEISRITGINGGHVLYSTNLDNPNNTNPANLGIVITSGQNLGWVLIRRGHHSQVNTYGNGNSIFRYYDILPENPVPFSANLRFSYFQGELNGLPENELVFWNSSDNLHWINQGFTGRNTTAGYVEKNGITDLSRWTLSGPINALPVQFALFNLKCDGNKVLLNWKTALEQNSSHYQVEKSTDGANWTVIGTVPAAGFSNTERSYFYNDNNTLQNSLYRIAQYDIDMSKKHTGILRSSCNQEDGFAVWPNPFTERIVISLTAGRASKAGIKIFDSKGSLVKKQEATVLQGINQLAIHTEHLPAGTYFLSVEWGTEQFNKLRQLIKQ